MEFTWRTVMLLLGIMTVVIIVFDGWRRMRRNREASLRLDIKKDFKFPSTDDRSEFPSGGSRVVSEAAEMASPVATSKPEKRQQEPTVELPDIRSDVDELLPDYRAEPFFTAEKTGKSGGSLLDPELGASLSSLTRDSETETPVPEKAPVASKKVVRKKVTRRPQVSKSQPQPSQQPVQAEKPQPSEPQEPRQADEPVSMESHVPVLMSVEQLGCEEAEAAMQPLRASEDELVQATAEASEYVEETGDDEPPVSEDIEQVEEITEEETAAPPSDLVLYADDHAERLSDRASTDVVLVIHVLSKDPTGFYGPNLLHLFKECDLRYGREGIFHRYEESRGRGPIQFSIVQMVEPGVFDPDSMEEQHFPGLTFFMGLPGPRQPMDAFRAMSELAQFMSQYLDAELKDDSHSVLGEQTLEHYRQQIMDFERQQQLAKKVAAARR